MKKLFTLLLLTTSFAQAQEWKIVPGKITSPWSEQVTPDSVLPEYPRPQFVRESWKSMNGLWDYVITPRSATLPAAYQGKILVPFAIESAMSGVGRTVGKDSLLWYHNTFTLPAFKKGNRTLLHFGAVDWQMTLYINGQEVGSHRGGFDPFSFDITGFLKKTKTQEMVVRVWDPTDQGPQPRGKQVRKPEGIWYTPVTGIWQTVWLESVPVTYIAGVKQTPDIDQQTLTVSTTVVNPVPGDKVRISVWNGTDMISEESVDPGATAVVKIPNMKLWSPEDPFLYDLRYAIVRKEKAVDEAQGYFAMRKTSLGKDNNGNLRMLLNNKFVFQYGPLDQGWWPDGLYTPPTYAAMVYDIDQLKKMGFNMIRKHIKVEPATYYAYCDKVGMLLWQDMPSGDRGNGWENRPGILDHATDKDRTPESEGYYRKEWNAIIDALYNYPSIVVWIPFNEAWGQFKTTEITEWTMKKDPSRLVNSASGGNFYPTGHIIDLHNYPHPAMPRPDLFGQKQILVLGEFGGLGLPLEGHTWQKNKNWGYQSFKTSEDMFKRYQTFTERLAQLIPLGLSAAVYTQTTDVEGEVNGFMTYDRQVDKMPVDKLHEANVKLYDPALVK